MEKRLYIILISCLVFQLAQSQEIKIEALRFNDHPRLQVGDTKSALQKMISNQTWANLIYNQSKKNVESYVNRHQTDSAWIVSRLMMFWKTKSTEIFIN